MKKKTKYTNVSFFGGGGGEPEYPGENPSEHGQLKARTSNKLSPHKTP